MLAQEEARLLKHDHIGTGHILLGVIREHGDLAGATLEQLEVFPDDVRIRVAEMVDFEEAGENVFHTTCESGFGVVTRPRTTPRPDSDRY